MYVTPVVTESMFLKRVDVVYEEQFGIANWMTVPFENSLAEDEIGLEPWMTTPFESSYCEDEIELENWMATAWT